MVYACGMCRGNRVAFVALDIATIFNHYGRYHRHDPNFFVRCNINGCLASYRKLEGLKSHIRRHHKNEPIRDDLADGNAPNEEMNVNFGMGENNVDEPEDMPGPQIDFQKNNAMFLLKMKENYQMSTAAITALLCDTTSLVQSCVEQIHGKVKDCLNNAGIELENVPGLQEVFRPENEIANPFNGLTTKLEQKQYFQENFGLVVSADCTVNIENIHINYCHGTHFRQ